MSTIELSEEEVEDLRAFVKQGRKRAIEVVRAYILLLSNKGRKEAEIEYILEVSRSTVSNIKRKYREDGLERALHDNQRSGQPKKYTDEHEAEIIALACSDPPQGRERWTIRLLTKRLERKKKFKGINRETVRLILKKANLNLG